jgi:biotin carboxyl carrier protein
MQLEVTVDGETTQVEVDRARGVVRWNGREIPAKVLRDKFGKVELEVAGEKHTIEGWPDGASEPPAPVVVNGEQYRAGVQRVGPIVVRVPTPAAPTTAPPPPVSAVTGPGTALLPPMPGKIVELRVKEGDKVEKGQVVLVLEAMKMRNEVTAPVAGRIADVRVAVGTNVRAREPMLSVVP